MEGNSIAVELRDGKGKEFNRKLRASGRVPAVVYGHGKQTVSVSVDPAVLDREIKTSQAGRNTLFNLEGDASVAGRTVLVKEIQREPIKGDILHADFFEVNLAERINVSVPVHVVGTSPGVTMGGVLEHMLRQIELACLPGSIPDGFVADVSHLEMGQTLHVSDLELPEDVELLTDPSLSVLSIIEPRAVEEEEEEEAELGEEEAEAAAEGEEKGEAEPASTEGGES